MGKLKGITINTDPAAEAHICAEDDAAIYQSIVGSDGVMMIGQQCESQVISNNKVGKRQSYRSRRTFCPHPVRRLY